MGTPTNSDPRFATIFEKLAALVSEVPPLRDLLDLTIGAAASFIRAEQLGYQDRSFALPNDYYEHLAMRAKRMAKGTLPPTGYGFLDTISTLVF